MTNKPCKTSTVIMQVRHKSLITEDTRTKNPQNNNYRQPKSALINILIAQISHQNSQAVSISAINNQDISKIPSLLTFPSTDNSNLFKPKSVLIFPDSGASLCRAGTQHLPEFDNNKWILLQCKKQSIA